MNARPSLWPAVAWIQSVILAAVIGYALGRSVDMSPAPSPPPPKPVNPWLPDGPDRPAPPPPSPPGVYPSGQVQAGGPRPTMESLTWPQAPIGESTRIGPR